MARLPVLVKARKAAAPEQAEKTVAPTPCRVLVVDDNVDSAESLNVLLELTGNKTRAAYDGLGSSGNG